MNYLKQSTAATIKLGPFVDDTDGKTAETGLTISQADVRLSKAGGAFAQKNDATGATHDENGYYGVPLDATDTGTVGRLDIGIAISGALPVWASFFVVPAAVFNALTGGAGGMIPADAVALSGDTIAADNAESFFDGTGYAGTNNTIPTVTTLTNAPADMALNSTVAKEATLGVPANGTVSADLAAIKGDSAAILTDTGTDGVVVAAASKSGYALSAAGVQAVWEYGTRTLTSFGTLAADTASAVWAAGARTLTGFGTLAADAATAVWASVARTITDKTGFSLSAAGVQAVQTGLATTADITALNDISSGDVETAVGTALTAYDAATGTDVGNLNNLSSADAQAAAAAALTAYDPPTRAEATSDKGEILAAIPSAGTIADAVLDDDGVGRSGLIPTNLDGKISEVTATVDLTPVTDVLDDMKGATFDTSTDSLEEIRDAIDAIDTGTGSGDTAWTYTVTVDAAPSEGAAVYVYSDAARTVLVASGTTDALGQVTFHTPTGTYYIAIDAPGVARQYDSETIT